METREIEKVFTGPPIHWVGDGFKVSNYFPSGENLLERFSPFILLDYNAPTIFPPSDTPRGVGPHPHRGFETVTFAFSGAVEHHDNQGNHGIIYPGDVQWMTAAAGIMHKEYHEKKFSRQGGEFHVIQLWVNLPAKDKTAPPHYQAIENSQMGKYTLENGQGSVTVVAGDFSGVKGPARTYTPMNIYTMDLKKGAELELNEPANFNVGMLVLSGSIKVNTEVVHEKDFLLFSNRAGMIRLEALSDDVKAIVLSGEPINEPVVASGPFVMNTREEILTANRDFYAGKFGTFEF